METAKVKIVEDGSCRNFNQTADFFFLASKAFYEASFSSSYHVINGGYVICKFSDMDQMMLY